MRRATRFLAARKCNKARGADRGRSLGGFYEAQARGGALMLRLPRADERLEEKTQALPSAWVLTLSVP